MSKPALFTGLVLFFCLSAFAQETPSGELSVDYSYLRFTGDGAGANFHGASASIAGNVNSWLGVVADFGGYGLTGGGSETLITYLFGPLLSYRKQEKVTPFVQALFGGATVSGGASAFAMTVGGGVDVKVREQVAIRVVQAEYLLTRFGSSTQNHARVSAGIVSRFGRK